MPSTDPFQSLTPTGEVDRAVQGLKVPPHSVEAEQSVIGALLLDNSSWDWVAPILRETDFYRTEHAIIFQAIGKLVNDNKPADVLTVHEELKSSGLAENFGITYLNQLTNNTPSAANVRGYAQIISDRSILRRLIQTADNIAHSAFDPEGKAVRTLLDEAESRILAIGQEGGRTKDYHEIDELMTDAIARIEELQARGNTSDITGIATGFIDLDKKTSGLQKGDLVIVAGRPSMGKAQPLDAQIKTLTGWKKMQDVMVGDALATIDGALSHVTGVYPQGRKEIFKVVFSDGRATECCAEHLWRVSHDSWDQAKVLTTQEIQILLADVAYDQHLRIDSITGDFGSSQNLPMDPWLVGALFASARYPISDDGMTADFLHDGELQLRVTTPAFSKMLQYRLAAAFENQIVSWHWLQADLWQVRVHLPIQVNAPQLYQSDLLSQTLMGLGFSQPLAERSLSMDQLSCLQADNISITHPQKRLPSAYLLADKQARLAMLDGLLAAQGIVSEGVSKVVSKVVSTPDGFMFQAENLAFAQDVAQLVRSIGGHAQLISGNSSTTSNWMVEIILPSQAFTPSVTFVSITPTRRAQAQCISVSHPSRTYLTDDYVVTHNTSFAMNIAENVAIKEGLPVIVFSMEMGAAQLATRMLGSVGRVNQGRLRTGQLNDEEWRRFTSAIGLLSKAPILIDESGSLSSLELRARARRMARKYGKVGLIVIDYLQLMAGKGGTSGENRATEISEISRSLKSLAKEMGCPVVALSQLNRGLENRDNKRPIMSDLRECVPGDTLVHLADGTQLPIKELVGTTPQVLAMDADQCIIEAKSDLIWSVGIKPVFKIEGVAKSSLQATAQHRIYTDQGWKTISALQIGDKMATLSSSNHPVITWEPIASIEALGATEVFDLTVPTAQSWIANGIVSHNSGAIEQDADVIIFIYRDEVYHPETEKPGVAEIIIGKQRNGPIGVVELSWQGEFTKFDNLAYGYNPPPFAANNGGSPSGNVPF